MSTLIQRMREAAKNSRSAPRKVKLVEGEDFTCALLGSLGFSTRYIMEHTEFSTGQISYRLRLGGIKRSDYRDGKSTLSGTIMKRARNIAIPEVKAHLAKVIEERTLLKMQSEATRHQLPKTTSEASRRI